MIFQLELFVRLVDWLLYFSYHRYCVHDDDVIFMCVMHYAMQINETINVRRC